MANPVPAQCLPGTDRTAGPAQLLTDAEVFNRLKQRDELARLPVLEVLRTAPRSVLITTGLRISQVGLFVLLTTYSLTYLQDLYGKGSGKAAVGLIAVLISSAVGLVEHSRVGRCCGIGSGAGHPIFSAQ